jgi:hypothetical protein
MRILRWDLAPMRLLTRAGPVAAALSQPYIAAAFRIPDPGITLAAAHR